MLHVHGPGSDAPTTCQAVERPEVQLKTVNPLGSVNVPPLPFATTRTRTSFCCAPAGLSRVMLSPLSTVFVVKERNQMGLCRLSATVTLQVRVPVGCLRATASVAPTPEKVEVAVWFPVAPAAPSRRSFASRPTLLEAPWVFVAMSSRSQQDMAGGGVHWLPPPVLPATV